MQWVDFLLRGMEQVRIGPPLVSVTISTVYSYACLATQACACSIEKKVPWCLGFLVPKTGKHR